MHLICTDLCNFNYARRGYPSVFCCLLNLSIFAFSSSCTSSLAPSARCFTFYASIICFPSPLSFFLPVPPRYFWFLASALTFISFCVSSTLSQQPSPSTSTNILIIPWKPPRLRVLTRSWKTRPSVPPRGSALSFPPPLPPRASLNFALEFHSLFHSTVALPFRPPLSPSTFVNDGEHTNTGSRLVVW